MGKKKIKPKHIRMDVYDVMTGRGYIKDNQIFNILRKPYSIVEKKDNNKWGLVNSGGNWKQKIRFPSLKRSMRVWKNFYTLFPLVYIEMRKQVESRGLKNGDDIEISLNEIPGYFNEVNDKQKVKVVDLGGLEMMNVRVKTYCYWKINQTEHDKMVKNGDIIKENNPQR